MHAHELEQLAAWLAGTDIGWLELRGPNECVRLRNDGVRVDAVPDDPPSSLDAASAAMQPVVATAMSVGVFLHRHPLQDAPLVRPGARVRAGQALGLLRIGALLLPVTAPKDATVAGTLVAHGETVGFGTPLVELQPIAEGG